MTGYLGRMAARVSGREPGIVPRVPSRFEVADRAEPVAVDPATTEGAGIPPAPRPAAAPSRPVAISGVGAEQVRPTSPPATVPDRTAGLSPPAPVRAPSAAPRRTQPLSTEGAGLPPVQPGEASGSTSRPSSPAARAASVRDLLVVPAAPTAAVSSTAPLASATGSASVDTSAREPDVVRVSIGRVDVRATMAPPRPPAAPEPVRQPERASAERLSLQDYLRGQREVR